MKCKRPKCPSQRGREAFGGFCPTHYEAFRKEREAKGGRKIGHVPCEPVVEHVAKLKAAGLGYRQIAKLAGVAAKNVLDVGNHPLHFTDFAHRILSVKIPGNYETAADGHRIPVLGTTRRLQALNAIGWANRVLADKLGVSENTVSRWASMYSPLIRAGEARKVDRLFRELQLVNPPESVASKRAKLRARRNNWPPPLAWDVETIDRPSSLPDLGVKGDFMDTVKDFRDLGRDDHYIADFLGIKVESLRDKIRRLNAA